MFNVLRGKAVRCW